MVSDCIILWHLDTVPTAFAESALLAGAAATLLRLVVRVVALVDAATVSVVAGGREGDLVLALTGGMWRVSGESMQHSKDFKRRSALSSTSHSPSKEVVKGEGIR